MNETQNTKRKYGNYCLRGQFGQIKRKCHTGTCVDKINKIMELLQQDAEKELENVLTKDVILL